MMDVSQSHERALLLMDALTHIIGDVKELVALFYSEHSRREGAIDHLRCAIVDLRQYRNLLECRK